MPTKAHNVIKLHNQSISDNSIGKDIILSTKKADLHM